MKDTIRRIISSKRNLLIIFTLLALTSSIQSLLTKNKAYYEGGPEYLSYNNYRIFEQSFYHLKDHQDLYISYPEEYCDLYKYTPTFSAFFGLFAIFPDWLGLSLWNLLNALILFFAVWYLPRISKLEKGLMLLIVLIELMTSMQNVQSNALIAGLIILSFGLLENKKYLLAALCLVFSAYIKLFGVVGFALFLFYPQKWRLALYAAFWTALLFIIPLVFVSFGQYIKLLQGYRDMLSNDLFTSYGYSVMGWLNSWFKVVLNKYIIVITGVALFLVPLFRFKEYENYTFRFLTLTSILIWVVIFNHKAESATFIIAMTGVSLWFITSEKSPLNVALFIVAFLFTSLSPTDIFPGFIREGFVKPYTLKALPCILIWGKIIYDMIALKNDKITENYNSRKFISLL